MTDYNSWMEGIFYRVYCEKCGKSIGLRKGYRDKDIAEHMKIHGIKKWWRFYKDGLTKKQRQDFRKKDKEMKVRV